LSVVSVCSHTVSILARPVYCWVVTSPSQLCFLTRIGPAVAGSPMVSLSLCSSDLGAQTPRCVTKEATQPMGPSCP
jgi:hypothetical protein